MLVTFALVDFGANSRLYPICCQLVPCGSKLAATDKCRLQFLEKILTLLLLLALPFFKRKFLRFHDANIGKEADVINQLKNDAVSCLLVCYKRMQMGFSIGRWRTWSWWSWWEKIRTNSDILFDSNDNLVGLLLDGLKVKMFSCSYNIYADISIGSYHSSLCSVHQWLLASYGGIQLEVGKFLICPKILE